MELAPPHARLTAFWIAIAMPVAVASSSCAAGASGRSARGPPLPVHIALERAHQALCAAGGVESPRALLAAIAHDPDSNACSALSIAARVRCYLALPDSTVAVRPIPGGYRIWFAMPRLSDHVHEVTVRRSGDRIAVTVDSRN